MAEITPFTRKAKVRVHNPAEGSEEFFDADVNCPSPNIEEDTTEKSKVTGDDEEFKHEDSTIIISSYNSIAGGEITATWDGEEAEVEILESDVD